MNIDLPKLIVAPYIDVGNFIETILYLTDQIDIKTFCVFEENEKLKQCDHDSDNKSIADALFSTYMWQILLIFEKNKFPTKYTHSYIINMASKKSNRQFCMLTEMDIKDFVFKDDLD